MCADVGVNHGRGYRVRPPLLTVGIDIGGTKVAAGVVNADGQVIDEVRRDTPTHSPQAVEDAIADIVTAFAERHDIHAVGIGAAGFVDAHRAAVLFSPHLAWRNEPLRDAVSRRLRLPVAVDNDANAAAWAELRFGAGQGESHLALVNLGTGIGGALVTGGAVQRGRYGIAGEFGHMQLVPNGHRCECGNRGCWEQYASGNKLVREARELVAANSPAAHQLIAAVDGDPAKITGPLVTRLAMAGDRCAVDLFDEIGYWLGVGIANLASAFDPGLFIIGGGVSDAGELLLNPARDAFRRTLSGRGFRPEARIVRAQLGPNAGLIGAADLSRPMAKRSRRARSRRSRRTR